MYILLFYACSMRAYSTIEPFVIDIFIILFVFISLPISCLFTPRKGNIMFIKRYLHIMLLSAILIAPAHTFAAPSLDAAYGRIPRAFTLNEGQAPAHIRFTARGSGCGMAFSPHGATFLLTRETSASVARRAAKRSILYQGNPAERDNIETESFALGLEFVGANENPEIVGEDRLPWNNNYFIGNDPSKWRSDVPNYGKIRFKEIYRGIDIVYYGNRKRVKYDFVVKQGEDPEQILLKYDFGEYEGSLSVNEKGELVVKTPVGKLIEEKPYCYQKIGGKEVEVEIGYEVMDYESYRFRVGEYDGRYDLVIDPELVYSTYLGGDSGEYVADVAIDEAGYVYVTGKAVMLAISGVEEFPLTPGSYDTSYNGGTWDVFVTKLNRDGSQIIYSTLIGGNHIDEPTSIALDSDNNVVVAGKTISENFPQTDYSYSDKEWLRGFVIKLNKEGNQLVFSSLFSGSCDGIAIGNNGDFYITGQPSPYFTTTPGAYDEKQGNQNVSSYIRRLSNDGTNLRFSTLIESCSSSCIICDDEGNAYIGGQTWYYEFPTTPSAYDTSYCLGLDGTYKSDGFIAQLSADGRKLLYASFWGGTGADTVTSIQIDTYGHVIFCGTTESTDLPVTENAPYPTNPGFYNLFLTRMDIKRSKLLLSTYFGGNQAGAPSIALDTNNDVFMTGFIGRSPSFPVTGDAFWKNSLAGSDAFISVFSLDGQLQYSSFWGGTGSDRCRAIAVNGKGDVAIAGETVLCIGSVLVIRLAARVRMYL